MNIKKEDHERYQDIINKDGYFDDIIYGIEECQKLEPDDYVVDEAIFIMTYLKKLRKGVYESIFESLRNKVPPLIALAAVLGVLGVKEEDIDAAFGMKTSAVSGLYVPE